MMSVVMENVLVGFIDMQLNIDEHRSVKEFLNEQQIKLKTVHNNRHKKRNALLAT